MLKGRLGLETARIPHVDRHGLVWLSYGSLYVSAGTLRFASSDRSVLAIGDYGIPFQAISLVLLGPGTSVTHDALRLLARHKTGLIAVGDDGVRVYTSAPFGPHDSALARRQVRLWADADNSRLDIARKLYSWRFGEVLPHKDIQVLRGMEGARMKQVYVKLAEEHGVVWHGRRYDRSNPESADLPNQAINHAATAVEAAATVSIYATGAIPQLGFIHEDSASSFILDIADLFRDTVTLPIAFSAVGEMQKRPEMSVDRIVRYLAGRRFGEDRVIDKMIDKIKDLLNVDDCDRNS